MPDTRKLEPAHGWPRTLALALLFSGAYFAACWLGLAISAQMQGIVTIWPASGILLAVLLLTRPRDWPLWLVVALVATAGARLLHGESGVVAFAIGCARCAESAIAAGLYVALFGSRARLDSSRELLGLALLSALGGSLLSALLGAAVLHWGTGVAFELAWRSWSLSAIAGVMSLTPPIVYLANGGLQSLTNCPPSKIVEGILLYLLLGVSASLVIGAPFGDSWVQRALLRPILCYPLLLWAAYRVGPGGTALGFLLVAVIAVGHTLHGDGVFAQPPPLTVEHLLALDGYLAFAALLSLFPALFIAAAQRVEAALHESERRLRLALQAAHMGIWEWEIGSNRVYWSDEIPPMLGLTPGEYAGTYEAFVEMIEPADRAAFSGVWAEALEHPTPDGRCGQQFRFRRPNDELLWLENHAILIRNSAGQPQRMLGTVTDITDRKLVEEARRESEQRYRAISEITANIAFAYRFDDTGKTTREWVAGDYFGIFGYQPDEVEALGGWRAIFHPDDLSHTTGWLTALQRGEPVIGECRIVRKDGGIRWLRYYVRPVIDPATGRFSRLYGASQDITEQRLAEEQLRLGEAELAHVARLSTLGELVAGISHEITQPLSAISNYAAACSTALEAVPSPHSERLLEWTRQISAQADRAGGIITRLRNFSRKSMPDRVLLNLNELIEESVELIAFETRRAGITVDLALAADVPLVPADRIQIQQVVINLLRNANDALQAPSVVERRVEVSTRVFEGACEVRVADHGPGVPASAVENLFTPFYTTKAQGLGLGLPISRSIVDSHGGRIWLEPTPGGGATFCFTLPIAPTAPGSD